MRNLISHSENENKPHELLVTKRKSKKDGDSEDVLLWNELVQGCEISFARIYQKYFMDLYRYGCKLCNEKEPVKDCIHDLYVDLWNKKEQLVSVSNVRQYLLTSVKRRLINYHHSSKKLTLMDSFEDQAWLISESREHEIIDIQTLKAKHARISEALNKLTDRQKRVLNLKFFDNYTNKEIARELSIDINSTYNLISKALKRLRSSLTIFF